MGGELIDVSVPLHPDMPTWPNETEFSCESRVREEQGDVVVNSTVRADVHAGTHVDAPAHFLARGMTVDQLGLDTFVGPCRVVDMRHVDVMDVRNLEAAGLDDLEVRILFKTRNSGQLMPGEPFRDDYVALTPEAATWLARRELRLVGTDYLSIERFGGDHETHRVLLRNGVVILEGLDLSNVEPGHYRLFCFPLRYAGMEAAPVRAILQREGS